MARPVRPLVKPTTREPRAIWAALATALRAGTIGAGALLAIVGTVFEIDGFRRWSSEETVLVAAVTAGFVVGMRGAYTTKPTSFLALGGRLVGALFAGTFMVMVGILASAVLHDLARSLPKETTLAIFGVLEAIVGLAWGRVARIRAFLEVPLRARTGAVAGGFVGLLLFVWPHSPLLRCVAGSGRACGLVATRAENDGERATALAFAERGCRLEDGSSCARAGGLVWEDTHDRRRAEALYREACASGSEQGCDEMSRFELVAGCESQSATACHRLADRTFGEPARGGYLKAACLLGDDSACR